MKRLCATAAIFLLSGDLAAAQGVSGATGPAGSGTTGPTNPSPAPVPPEAATVGRGIGVNSAGASGPNSSA